jgi:hypothetical protein
MTLARTPFTRKPAAEPKVRMRRCAVATCRAPFAPRSMTHKCCSPACAERHVAAEKARRDRKDRQEGLAKLKRRADHLEDAQKAFNAWVRARDAALPCICCGKSDVSNTGAGGGWDAGHYLSRGSHPHLRFDERNVFRQRKGCNRPGGTSAAAFRLGVIARIGLAAVEALESDQESRKWSIEQLIEIKNEYRARLKALTNSRASA